MHTPISNKKKSYLECARQIAQKSSHLPHRHGAILVKNGNIINTSYNRNKYNKFAERFKTHEGRGTIHAELGCVLGLDKSVTKNQTIYVVRINRDNEFRLSKPCGMCLQCLSFVGIKKVFYSINEDNMGVISL